MVKSTPSRQMGVYEIKSFFDKNHIMSRNREERKFVKNRIIARSKCFFDEKMVDQTGISQIENSDR